MCGSTRKNLFFFVHSLYRAAIAGNFVCILSITFSFFFFVIYSKEKAENFKVLLKNINFLKCNQFDDRLKIKIIRLLIAKFIAFSF